MKSKLQAIFRQKGLLILSFVFTFVGIFLLLYPAESIKTLCYLTAGITVLVGLVLLANGLSQNKKQWKYALSILGGGAAFVSGILLFFLPENLFLLYCALVGLLMIINGSFALHSVFQGWQTRGKTGWAKLAVSMLVIFGGFLCVRLQDITAANMTVLFGITLTLTGVLNFLSFLTPPPAPKQEVTENTEENA